jgi:triphosphoribosyl-dephospho-CoA synthase
MSASAAAAPSAHLSGAMTSARCVIGRSATVALYQELALYPKPGLVSFVDTGSHTDMNAAIFMRSLFALRHYFASMVAAGSKPSRFAELERQGIVAERKMLLATGGINTHPGAIFSLGLLCAAAGGLRRTGERPSPQALRRQLLADWGDDLRARCDAATSSHGQGARRRFGLRSAGEEAALGFPVLFDVTVPALQAARRQGLDPKRSRLQAFFETMAVLDDTNLAQRGGLDGLRWAQGCAQQFIDAGGAARPAAIEHAQSLHRAFVARRLSPGGCADVLAAACWVDLWMPA